MLVEPSPDNAKRVLRALREFGFSNLNLSEADLVEKGSIVQLGIAPNRIDLVTTLSGVAFEEAWKSRVVGELEGLAVNVIGLDALISNKESTGRLKDRADVEELKKRNS